MALDLPVEIVGLDDSTFVNILVYAKSGTGKTVFAGSDDRVLFLATEDDGTISALNQGSKAQKWKIKHWTDMAKAVAWLQENEDELTEQFDWVSVDSATDMQQLMLRYILEVAVEDNEERDPDIPAIQDHQKWQNMFKRFVRAINDLPINVCWTALVRAEEDEDGEDFLTPDIQGKGYQLSQTIASYMTSYGYMEAIPTKRKKDGEIVKDSAGKPVIDIRRRITWRDEGKIQGKDRTDVLAPHTTDLSLKQIRQLVTGEKKREDFRKRPVKKAEPTKRAPAKKTNPANTPDNAVDVNDSVPQHEGAEA